MDEKEIVKMLAPCGLDCYKCVACQESEDAKEAAVSGYNRRGSKDSQLR